MTRDLIRYPAGGIIFFGKNLTDPDGLQRYMDTLSSASDIPLLYAVDEEGGIVSRIARTDSFGIRNAGPMGDIGATGAAGLMMPALISADISVISDSPSTLPLWQTSTPTR